MDFEFLKNPTVETLDKVPEQFRGFYGEGEGGFVLQDSFKGTAGAVDGLNKSLKAARRDADEAKRNRPDVSAYAQVGQLMGLEGDEAMSADALRAGVERIISESKDGKVNWDKMKQSLENGFNTKLSAKDAEIQGMGKSLQKYLVNSAAVSAIAAHKGVPDLLLPHITSRTKVIRDGEDYVVRVVDESGDPRGNASGGFMTVEDLVKELKGHSTFGRAFESESPNGGGKPPGSGTKTPVQRQGEKSATDKIKAGLAARQQR
ncbi:structural protein [Stenotrophomonas phage A1432]|uniref:Structural protein n=1 Tax=Stenotrophomonas phage A1432 TaxID=2930315 RepID=A0A9E7N154_9CAUD|nr:structural protein [Stenotrophomonas phage A1432]UTC27959.1 structural protein [Stenotrophomonas phage A1432]